MSANLWREYSIGVYVIAFVFHMHKLYIKAGMQTILLLSYLKLIQIETHIKCKPVYKHK
jgi:hypothetical protein